MNEIDFLKEFASNGGTTIDLEENKLLSRLPKDYINFMKTCNGGEGFVGEEYLILFRLEELEGINKDYKIEEFDKDIILIGSNGASEAIGLDLRNNNFKYILIPFLFEYEAIIELSDSFNGFIKRIIEKGYFE